MGRKAKYTEGGIVKKGPGRKTKKQKDPVFPKSLLGKYSLILYIWYNKTKIFEYVLEDKETGLKKLGHRQKVRERKRLTKIKNIQEKRKPVENKKKHVRDSSKKHSLDMEKSEESSESNNVSEISEDESGKSDEEIVFKPRKGFSDENKLWLKPKRGGKAVKDIVSIV